MEFKIIAGGKPKDLENMTEAALQSLIELATLEMDIRGMKRKKKQLVEQIYRENKDRKDTNVF